MAFVLAVIVAIPVTAMSAAPELRWIAYVRANRPSDIADQAAFKIVRSDGRRHPMTGGGRFLSVDLGPGGVVHAAQESEAAGVGPPSSLVVTAWTNEGRSEEWGASDAYYFAVAASSDGRVAAGRQVTRSQQPPPFLTKGIETLRSTSVPVLVPPEEPRDTGGLVPTAEEHSYQLLFTNDPAGELAHVEQVNVFISGTAGEPDPISGPESQRVTVRGTNGEFFCGASTCFLTWNELDTNYTVGEFGASEEAIAFAESLVPIETMAGSGWREGTSESIPTPELIVRERDGSERVLESVAGFCDCSFQPLDWNARNDRLLVLASVEGSAILQEYPSDGSGEPAVLAEGVAGPDGLIVDAAYGPDGVVALFSGGGGSPGVIRLLEGGDALVADVRAFDIEGSTLAYVSESGDVIVRDLSIGSERTVGEGAIDVSVAPDVISTGQGGPVQLEIEDDGPGVLAIILAVVAGLAVLAGAALLFVLRRRGLD